MEQIHLGHIIIEPDRNRIMHGGEVHRVTRREMDVLTYLVRNGTRVVSRKELLEGVWNDAVVNDEALTLVISRLRAVLSDNPSKPQVIETIPKKGYRLMLEVGDAAALEHNTERKRTGWVWVAVLAILLIIMTSLFTIVRLEYERVTPAEIEALTP